MEFHVGNKKEVATKFQSPEPHLGRPASSVTFTAAKPPSTPPTAETPPAATAASETSPRPRSQ